MKRVQTFEDYVNEKKSSCCNAPINEDDCCSECGSTMEEFNQMQADSDLYFEEAEPKTRKQVLAAAGKKYPNLNPSAMKKSLHKMKDVDFKAKAEKYFGWADDPEAAAAAFIRKATKKEPRDI